MLSCQQKVYETYKKTEYGPYTGKLLPKETVPEDTQKLDLLEKDFKLPIVNMLIELKETMFKELKECVRTTFHQIDNIKRTRSYKMKTKVQKLKTIMTERKNSLESQQQT